MIFFVFKGENDNVISKQKEEEDEEELRKEEEEVVSNTILVHSQASVSGLYAVAVAFKSFLIIIVANNLAIYTECKK